jgi:nicotinamidase-related amidase
VYCLIVIDFQERLVKHIEGIEDILRNTKKLVKACKIFGIPILVTEQVKLGKTVLSEVLDSKTFEKTSFSCVRCEDFYKTLKSLNPKACILTGIETHICVLQTALDLLRDGYDVFVAVDCTGSRRGFEKDVAIQRMISEGVKVSTAESLIYEIMGDAIYERFKDILKIVKE